MSRLAKVVDLSGIDGCVDAPALISVPRQSSELSAKYYQPLVERLCDAHRKQNRAIIAAFTSFSPGEGVTHVAETLAGNLAAETGEQVLLTTAAGLDHVAQTGFRIPESSLPEKVYRMEDPGKKPLPRGRGEGLQEVRLRFGFVLVDSPPLSHVPSVDAMFKIPDYVILVVHAGKTTYQEVSWAQRALTSASANLLGVVLNRIQEVTLAGCGRRA